MIQLSKKLRAELKKARKKRKRRKYTDTYRPLQFEPLEDRALLATLGFQFGIDDNGGFAIKNTSSNNQGTADSDLRIDQVIVNLSGDPDGTFFDTTNSSPGTASTGWSASSSNPFTTHLPSNSATDGEQIATITFSGFDRGEDGTVYFDLDRFSAIDGTGLPAGGKVSVYFHSGYWVTGTITTSNISLDGSNWDNSATGSLSFSAPSVSLSRSPSSGVGYDDSPSETMSWSISGSTSRSAVLRRPSGSAIASSGSTNSSFSISSSTVTSNGLGVYKLEVTAFNQFGDRTFRSTTMDMRDDDTSGPTINLGGSSATDASNNFLSWSVTDSASGISNSDVTVSRLAPSPTTLYSSTFSTSGIFDLNSQVPGTYRVTVSNATNNDTDRGTGDRESTATTSRTITITDDDISGPGITFLSPSVQAQGPTNQAEFRLTESSASRVGSYTARLFLGSTSTQVLPALAQTFSPSNGSGPTTFTNHFDMSSLSPGIYRLEVSATNNDRDHGSADIESRSATQFITINNVAPTLGTVSVNSPIEEGDIATVSGTFFDPGKSDSHTILIDWNAGGNVGGPAEGTTTITTAGPNPPGTTLTDLGGGNWSFSAVHPYIDDNPTGTTTDDYVIGVSVTDDNGGSDSLSSTVSTSDLNGDITNTDFNNATTSVFGPVAGATQVSFSTSGYAHAHSGTVDVFVDVHDPGTGAWTQVFSQTVSAGNNLSFNGLAVSFAAQTVDQVRLRSNPGQNQTFHSWGSTTISVTGSGLPLTVTNADPIANAGADQTVNEGDLVTLNGSFTDLGVDDGHKQEWSVVASNGQVILGQTIDNLSGVSNGFGGSSFSFTPNDNGTYTVSYAVTDDDGGTHTDTAVITVENVAPTLTLNDVDPIFENEFALLTGSFTDPGVADGHEITINWDDPNNVTNSTFELDATSRLATSYVSTSGDRAVLEITSVDLVTGKVSFSVEHQYLDDGASSLGNNTISDASTIEVTVEDDDGGSVSNVDATGLVTFNFAGEMLSSDADFTAGDQFFGSYTFDPSATGTAPPDSTLNQQYVSSAGVWELSFPSLGYRFTGTLNVVAVGNDTSFGDRYIATLHAPTSVGTPLPSGRTLSFAQFDIQDPVAFGADMLSDDSIQTTPINLSLANTIGGRFLFDDNSQPQLTLSQLSNTPSTRVIVKNVSPEVDLDPAGMIFENETVTISGSYTDPGTLDEHDVRVDWDDPNDATDSTFQVSAITDLSVGNTFTSTSGDGAVLAVTGLTDDTVSFSVQHQYLDDGPAPGNHTASDTSTISVTVDDDDTGTGNNTTTVSVNNVAPTVALNPVAMTDENGTATLTGSFTDPGTLDDHDVIVDWDDPNNSTDSTFQVSASGDLAIGNTFASTSADGAVLMVTDLTADTVSFSVEHQYLDDGPASSSWPGANGTVSDLSNISVTVRDDDLFVVQETIDIGAAGLAIVSADLNGDAHVDLAIAGTSGGTNVVTVLLNNGDGTFGTPTNFASGTSVSPTSLVSGDWDSNGTIDLAVGGSDAVTSNGVINVLLNDGTGSFSAPAEVYNTGNSNGILGLVTADFDGADGLDLAAATQVVGSPDTGLVHQVLNDGSGNFIAQPDVATFLISPWGSVVGDFDGVDGPDLALSTIDDNTGDAFVSVLFNDGSGTLTPPVNTPASTFGFGILGADLDGTNGTDIAIAGTIVPTAQSSLTTLLNDGSGAFGAPNVNLTSLSLISFGAVVADDWDVDGNQDIIVGGFDPSTGASGLVLFNGDGTGNVSAPVFGPLSTTLSGLASDNLNADSGLDLAVLGFDTVTGNGVVTLLFNSMDTAETTVTVNNDAPGVFLDSVADIDENGTATLTGSFTDVGLLDSHQISIDWDDDNDQANATFNLDSIFRVDTSDGSLTQVLDTAGFTSFNSTTDDSVLTINSVDTVNGVVEFTVTHQYLDDGLALYAGAASPWPGANGTPSDVSTIVAVVRDDDTGFGSVATDLVVNNVAPSISVGVDTTISENGTATLTGTITDIGRLDSQQVTIDWDDDNDQANATFNLEPIFRVDTSDGSLTQFLGTAGFTSFSSTTDDSVLVIDSVDTVNEVVEFTVTHQYLDDGLSGASWPGDNGTPFDLSAIRVTVADDDTGSDNETIDVTVNNVAPMGLMISSGAEECGNAHEDDPITLSGMFTDPGLLDTHEVTIDWGDANDPTDSVFELTATAGLNAGDTFNSSDSSVLEITSLDLSTGLVSFEVDHDYATGGVFTITVAVEDDDSGAAPVADTLAVVSGVGLQDGVLQIIGTSEADHVTLNQTGNGTLKVHADFIPEYLVDETRDFNLDDVDRILMLLCDGDDHATVSGRITLDTVIDGGEGDDYLNGGDGVNVILGRAGNDHINGGSARDLLFGGLGEDRIVGNSGRDLMSGGVLRNSDYQQIDTIADEDRILAMQELFKDAMDAEIDAWRAGTDSFFSDLGLEVADDNEAADQLTGSSADDWFIQFANDVVTDAHSNGKGTGGTNNGNGKK